MYQKVGLYLGMTNYISQGERCIFTNNYRYNGGQLEIFLTSIGMVNCICIAFKGGIILGY